MTSIDEKVKPNGAQAIRTFIAAANMTALNSIMHLLSDNPDFVVVDTALDGETCLNSLADKDIDIVIVELALPKISGVKIAEYLSLERPDIATVILADQSNLGFYRSAMLAGAREFLITPVPAEELAFSLRRVYEMEAERRRKRETRDAFRKPVSPSRSRDKIGKIVVVSGGKGGTGRSFIAANLAQTFALSSSHLEVAIADFDLQYGDMSAVFNQPAKKSLVDLVPVIDELSASTLKSVATKTAQKIDIYSPSPQLERSELITSFHAVRFLDAFRQNYDLTIVNTGALMSEIHVDLMEKADFLLLIANPEVMSVKACSQIRSLYDKLGYPRNAIGVVVNKAEQDQSLTPKKIAESLRLELVATIPSLPREVASLLNEGKLVMTDGSPVLRTAFTDLSMRLTELVGIGTPLPV